MLYQHQTLDTQPLPRPLIPPKMGYTADRSDFLFKRLHTLKNQSGVMSDELVLFEVERILIDGVEILDVENDSSTLDWLFNTASRLGNERLGVPQSRNVHSVVEFADRNNYKELLENMIRPIMYDREVRGTGSKADTVFIYRCFNAASIIAEYDFNRTPDYDFMFSVDAARKARDVVGEWLE